MPLAGVAVGYVGLYGGVAAALRQAQGERACFTMAYAHGGNPFDGLRTNGGRGAHPFILSSVEG